MTEGRLRFAAVGDVHVTRTSRGQFAPLLAPFAGAKCFCGGFGRGTLGARGERATRCFMQEANEAAQ